MTPGFLWLAARASPALPTYRFSTDHDGPRCRVCELPLHANRTGPVCHMCQQMLAKLEAG